MSEVPALDPNVAAARQTTIRALILCVQKLIPPMDEGPDRYQEYWDVVNDSGPFTDEELQPLGMTVDKLNGLINVIENYGKFVNNEAPTVSNYKTTLNTARRLSA